MSLSPMMQQYFQLKESCKDAILMFRLGDFYEMFFDDAVLVSRELELTLTGRDCGLAERAPMCGIPFHAAENYIARLIQRGHKVAIAEQTSQPDGGKMLKREIVRIVTAGTVTEPSMLNDDTNNYLTCVYCDQGQIAVAWTDITTGELCWQQPSDLAALNELLTRLRPAEAICNESFLPQSFELGAVKNAECARFSIFAEWAFDSVEAAKHLGQLSPKAQQSLSAKSSLAAKRAVGALLGYVSRAQKRDLIHLTDAVDNETVTMYLCSTARKTLELEHNMHDGAKKGTLLAHIDCTSTSFGARRLRKWLMSPLLNIDAINARYDAVGQLVSLPIVHEQLIQLMGNLADIERLATRASTGIIQPRECLKLNESLQLLPQICHLMAQLDAQFVRESLARVADCTQLVELISRTISPEAATNLRDGQVIAVGADHNLDQLRTLDRDAKNILTQLEQSERTQTGIKNLKIGYNRVFGYYIEVPRAQTNQVPFRYVRKQTVASGERYITEELKDLELRILSARDQAVALEQSIYAEFVAKLTPWVQPILTLASALAEFDCVCSLATVAKRGNYCRPTLVANSRELSIVEGRHPIVESVISQSQFVPNDTVLDGDESRTMIITGPNMSGKSVYMRQVALIVVLAQIGSFVPARRCQMGLIDRIFTRVGASDDVAGGRSTFMVEMSEVATILNGATDDSLVLLDEVGRGTSTYDGLSIAWAMLEYISQNFRCKTLFSTHYHELSELEDVLDGIKNYKLTVKETGGSIVFVRRLMRGQANKSFGIEVAQMAGLPPDLVKRAKEILTRLEFADVARRSQTASDQQLSIFGANDALGQVEKILRECRVDDISPRAALDILCDLKQKLAD